jgi:hypothetical protein
MGLFNLFKRRKFVENQGIITEEMRQRSLETRRMQHEINQLHKRLEMKEDIVSISKALSSGDEDNELLKMIAPIAMKFLSGNNSVSSSSPSPELYGVKPVNSANVEKNNQIVNLLNSKVPKEYIGELQNLTDEDILYIKNKLIEVNLP